MLHTITTLADPLLALIKDDPVRPDIPLEFRVSDHCCVYVLLDDEYNKPQAVVCVARKSSVPKDVLELAHVDLEVTHPEQADDSYKKLNAVYDQSSRTLRHLSHYHHPLKWLAHST